VRLVLLFAGAALLSGVTMLNGIQPNDEGLMLAAAARIAEGQVPYSDFWWFYPPGQPYLLAGLWELFGPSLLPWRIVRVLCDAGVAVLAYTLAVRGGASPRVALATWLAAALAMAYPSGPHPFPVALALALGALLLFEQRPLAAGALAGMGAAWRIEFAAYLGLGIVLAYALRPPQPARSGALGLPPSGALTVQQDRGGFDAAEFARDAGGFAAIALATAVLLFAPVVVAAGLPESWDLLVRYPLEDFGDYQSLPFPLDYDGPLNTESLGGFLSDSTENLLLFYLPLALVLGLAGALLALAVRFRRERWPQVATAVFALGMAHYLLTRPDVFHATPLAVMVAVLAAWAITGWREPQPAASGSGPSARRLAGLTGAGLAAAGLAYAIVEGLDRRWLELRTDYAELRLPPADGVRVREAARTPLERAVRHVRERVPPGRPIYVATRRSDLVTSGHPLFYVLADRNNPSRYDIQAPGVVTTAPVQREIVRDLRRTRTPVVVRWTAPLTAAREPNKGGEPTGVTILDDHLRRAYRPEARYGSFVILGLDGRGRDARQVRPQRQQQDGQRG
jgi:hypothetical protein